MSERRVEVLGVKSKAELRAERRTIQEGQRATKANKKALGTNSNPHNTIVKEPKNNIKINKAELKENEATSIFLIKHKPQLTKSRPQEKRCIDLFRHLDQPDKCCDVISSYGLGSSSSIHLSFLALGVDLDEGRISGSNERCLAFLSAVECLVRSFKPLDFSLNSDTRLANDTLFCRSFGPVLERHVDFLDLCRPLSVTVRNAYQYIKQILNRLDSLSDWDECRTGMMNAIEEFKRNSIDLAGIEIEYRTSALIRPGECICTFGYSSLVARILERAWRGFLSNSTSEINTDFVHLIHNDRLNRTNNKDRSCPFSVLIVDSRPNYEGRKMLIRLNNVGIPCEYTHIGALPTLAHKISLVIVGAHALLSNGYVLARIGAGQVANIASFIANAPVLVCAETYKFWERSHSDAFEYNEVKDPDDVWRGPRGKSSNRMEGLPGYGPHGIPNRIGTNVIDLSDWRSNFNLNLLNLAYDILSPSLVTAVVTEKGILPTTSVPVLLRVKQASIIPV